MVELILSYLGQALAATFIQILILFTPGLLLTLILHFETGFIQHRTINTLGLRWYLGLFGWLGTIIHELGHALFCLIFRHKITEMKLLDPDPETGTLGYVRHSYDPKNIYQLVGNFFIGIGPILLGTAVIFLLCYWLLGLNTFNTATASVTYLHIFIRGILSEIYFKVFGILPVICLVRFSPGNTCQAGSCMFLFTWLLPSGVRLPSVRPISGRPERVWFNCNLYISP